MQGLNGCKLYSDCWQSIFLWPTFKYHKQQISKENLVLKQYCCPMSKFCVVFLQRSHKVVSLDLAKVVQDLGLNVPDFLWSWQDLGEILNMGLDCLHARSLLDYCFVCLPLFWFDLSSEDLFHFYSLSTVHSYIWSLSCTLHIFSSYNGYKLNSYLTCLFQRGFIAQSVEHRTGIMEVMGLNPVGASELRRSLSLLF